MKLNRIDAKDVEIDEDGTRLYKYLQFSVFYGENSDKGFLEKADGTQVPINNDDYKHRMFYVFIAYPCDREAYRAVILLESKGNNSIQTPMRDVLKKCLKLIDDKRYTLEFKHFVDDVVINTYIDNQRVTKFRIIKNERNPENGAGMSYVSKEIVYSMPRGERFLGYLKNILMREDAVQVQSRIPEIDDFQPDQIKFEVKTPSVTKTYTAGNIESGLIQEEMPEGVVMADGITNADRILAEMKRICREQHF